MTIKKRPKPPPEARGRTTVVLALQHAIEATLTEATWRELGYATDTFEWVRAHPRLLKSCYFGDSDYPRHARDAIEHMLANRPGNLDVILGFGEIATWIRENRPHVYQEVESLKLLATGTAPPAGSSATVANSECDVFICHASEDKDAIARPLYEELVRKGCKVWFDEAVLRLGDSLRAKIDEGLGRCRYGVVILSHSFFRKEWPRRELDGLVSRETASGEKAILPVWHNVDRSAVASFSPTLADRHAARSSDGVEVVATRILEVLSGGAPANPRAAPGG
jgi:hypothetical protein